MKIARTDDMVDHMRTEMPQKAFGRLRQRTASGDGMVDHMRAEMLEKAFGRLRQSPASSVHCTPALKTRAY